MIQLAVFQRIAVAVKYAAEILHHAAGPSVQIDIVDHNILADRVVFHGVDIIQRRYCKIIAVIIGHRDRDHHVLLPVDRSVNGCRTRTDCRDQSVSIHRSNAFSRRAVSRYGIVVLPERGRNADAELYSIFVCSEGVGGVIRNRVQCALHFKSCVLCTIIFDRKHFLLNGKVVSCRRSGKAARRIGNSKRNDILARLQYDFAGFPIDRSAVLRDRPDQILTVQHASGRRSCRKQRTLQGISKL